MICSLLIWYSIRGKEAPKGRCFFFCVCSLFKREHRFLFLAGAGGTSVRKAEVGADVQLSEPRFAHSFYASYAWIKCARAYKREKGGLCERCLSKGLIVPGAEVHHKIRLTPENISDPAVALNWDNLELLCKNCHLEEHRGTRWRTDELGHVEL